MSQSYSVLSSGKKYNTSMQFGLSPGGKVGLQTSHNLFS